MNLWKKIFGDPDVKYVKKLAVYVAEIESLESKYRQMPDAQLQDEFASIRERVRTGESNTNDVLNEVFAIVKEVAQRTLGFSHRNVQLMGGIVMHRGQIAEMLTGEGKTLVCTLPVVLNALKGEGVHVVTVNDYLARRDAGWMAQIYHFLGLTTGVIIGHATFLYDPTYVDEGQHDERLRHLRPASRREAYEADITYGTNNEYGFDYLRDNMAQSIKYKSQRGLAYAIIDEVDSILIDEARTPLIISAPAEDSNDLYVRFATIARQLTVNEDFNIDEKMRAVTLTTSGVMRVEKILGIDNLYQSGIAMVHNLEAALKAQFLFSKDKDYIVQDGEIKIIDEFTGRMLEGRRYSDGIHQAIEAKEGVEVKQESKTLATITFQNYFRLYKKIAGMTGTAKTEEEEFINIYSLEVIPIPPFKPVGRKDFNDRIYSTHNGKMKAIVREIAESHKRGQPVLVGTISIERNEELSEMLSKAGIPHALLNAKNHLKEADIIAQAGKVGSVTIATNMAGRGVDIKLGGDNAEIAEAEKVKGLGGLYVIGTERHESRRIDNQLRGRTGRWGDPGMSTFFVSLEDDLMRIFGSDRMKNMVQRLGVREDEAIENKIITKAIEQSQKRVEGHHFDARKHVVEYDDVLNKQRATIYGRRNELFHIHDTQVVNRNEAIAPPSLDGKRAIVNTRDWAIDLIDGEIEQVVSFYTVENNEKQWNTEEVYETVNTIFDVDKNTFVAEIEKIRAQAGNSMQDMVARSALFGYIANLAREKYKTLESAVIASYGDDMMTNLEMGLYLESLDRLWSNHLSYMAHLKDSIRLKGYAQQDPLVEYKREGYQMFMRLLDSIQNEFVYNIFKFTKVSHDPAVLVQKPQEQKLVLTGASETMEKKNESNTSLTPEHVEKIGRNEPCPCGAKKPDGTPVKYKHCHGK